MWIRKLLTIILFCLIAVSAQATIFISENWDTGTPDACWPCKSASCGTFDDWDSACPSEYGGSGCVTQAGVTSSVYHTSPNSFLQYKQSNTADACNFWHSLSTNPTTIYIRFYIYFTSDFTSSTLGGDGLLHWIFTNSLLSNTGFRLNMVTNNQIGECTAGHICIMPEGDGGQQWWSGRTSCTGGGEWGTTYLNTVDVKDLVGAWHSFEYKMQISGSNVILTEWLDGVQTRGPCTGPGQNTSNFATIYISDYENSGTSNNLKYYIDDIVVADAYIGPLAEGDTTAPTTTISTSDPSSISSDSLIITGTASDAVGVSGCKWRKSSAPDASNGTACTGTTSFSCSTSGYTSGSNTMYVGCYDAAGNYGSDSITVNYSPIAYQRTGVKSTGGTWK